MTEKKDAKHIALDQLTDALVENILATPDADLLKEEREAGNDPSASAKHARALYERASISVAKKKLQDAKAALQAERRPRVGAPGKKLDPAVARTRLNVLLEQHPETKTKLTMAARKGEGLSDADVQSMLEDLEELGVHLPSDKLDD
jgi:hypothetical protein